MRLVTFAVETSLGSTQRFGVLQGEQVVDGNAAYCRFLAEQDTTTRVKEIADALVPPDMLRYLQGGEISRNALESALAYLSSLGNDATSAMGPSGERVVYSLVDVHLRAPVCPPSIREFSLCEGHIGRAGTRELPPVWYEMPTYWKGNPSSVIGPDETIPWPSFSDRLDYELEIAAVVGRRGTNIPADRAYEYIAGFTIFNDVSTRDMQEREKPMGHGPAKSKDFCNVLGPALVTADETDGLNMRVFVRINGEVVAESRNDDMRFNWAQLIEHISLDETILPGDVLCSGVVTGCAGVERAGWSTAQAFLRAGDIVELGVDGIGILRNQIGKRRTRL